MELIVEVNKQSKHLKGLLEVEHTKWSNKPCCLLIGQKNRSQLAGNAGILFWASAIKLPSWILKAEEDWGELKIQHDGCDWLSCANQKCLHCRLGLRSQYLLGHLKLVVCLGQRFLLI